MKKRITSLLIACAILLGMLPAMGLTADATGTGVYVANVEMAEGSYLANGAAETTATQPSGGYAHYADGVLTLNNYEYAGSGYHWCEARYAVVYAPGDLEVLLQGQNKLTQTDESSMGIYTVGALTVDGEGSITLEGAMWSLFSGGNMTIDGGNIAASTQYSCLRANGMLTVNGGTIDAIVEANGLDAAGGMVINGGTITLSRGAESMSSTAMNLNGLSTFEMNGGTITVSDCSFGINGTKSMHFVDGTVKLNNVGTGLFSYSGNITIDGGTMEITASVYAIEVVGGTVYMNGGTVDAASTADEMDEYVCAIRQNLTIDPSLMVMASTEPDGQLEAYVPEKLSSYDRIVITGEKPVCETHSYGQWYAVEIPTCQEYGKIGKTCKLCGYVTYADVEKIDHVYIPEVTPPTTTAQGYTTYTCYFCGDSYVDDYVPALEAEAQIGTVIYATVEEALMAAMPGDTVVLLKDVDASESVLLVSSGVILDLLDYSLSAKSLIGLKGSMITGAVVDKNGQNGAKLVVSQANIALSQDAPDGAAAGYKIIPVWNGDHYIFSQAVISNQKFEVNDGTAKVTFLPNFSGYIKNSLFKTDGCEDNDVSIIISVSWLESGIRVTQEYFYTKSLVIDAMNNKGLYAVMTGCDEKEELVFSISIVTNSGVKVVSQDYAYDNYK